MYWNDMEDSGEAYKPRLIETWDVLKFSYNRNDFRMIRINRNMRCIEIMARKNRYAKVYAINRNMRCIETIFERSSRRIRFD